MATPHITRRTVLAAGVTGAGALALAACGNSTASDSSGTNAAGNPAGSTAAPASSGAGSGETSSAPASSGGGSASGTSLAKLDDISVGEAVSAKLDGKPVLVSRPTSSTAACFSAICTHEGCTVAPAGKELHCPCHQSVFNAATGAVISGPAPRALDKVDVSVENGSVVATA